MEGPLGRARYSIEDGCRRCAGEERGTRWRFRWYRGSTRLFPNSRKRRHAVCSRRGTAHRWRKSLDTLDSGGSGQSLRNDRFRWSPFVSGQATPMARPVAAGHTIWGVPLRRAMKGPIPDSYSLSLFREPDMAGFAPRGNPGRVRQGHDCSPQPHDSKRSVRGPNHPASTLHGLRPVEGGPPVRAHGAAQG